LNKDYKPFGEQIPLMTTKTRKTYIGKERDEESYLGDFGVRKYDYAAGNRFTSPDVLWEKIQ
jgi:RHS repeat-associated protein